MIDDVLKERSEKYNVHGTYQDHATITQAMKQEMRKHAGWKHLHPAHQEACDMICHKIARVINGDPYYDDNWKDIQGYAKLAQDTPKKEDPYANIKASFVYEPKKMLEPWWKNPPCIVKGE